MNKEQREKLKESLHDIVLRAILEYAPAYGRAEEALANDYVEKILQEVEKTYRKYDYQVTMERGEKVQ